MVLTKSMGHWAKRGECITEFHRRLGRMPLRYSHGKAVEAAVGEPRLCSKVAAPRFVRVRPGVAEVQIESDC
jgi:hypothetical protein